MTVQGTSTTFEAPAAFNGTTIQIGVQAVSGSYVSPMQTLTVTVKPHSSWINSPNGTWVARRAIEVAPGELPPVVTTTTDGGQPDSTGFGVIDGGTPTQGAADVIDGGELTTTVVSPDTTSVFIDALGAVDFIDALGATQFLNGPIVTDPTPVTPTPPIVPVTPPVTAVGFGSTPFGTGPFGS